MTEENLPIPAPEFEASTMPPPARPMLRMDHGAGDNVVKAGSLLYLNQPIESPELIFFAMRGFRTYFAASYNKDPEAPMTCASWDGENAFGYGGRRIAGSPVARVCSACPLSTTKDKDEWCKPQALYFGLVNYREAAGWMPFFFEVRGVLMGAFADAFRAAMQASRDTADKSLPPQERKARLPIYCFSTPVLGTNKLKGKNAYEIKFGSPRVLGREDIEYAAKFVTSMGKSMWQEELERAKSAAFEIEALATKGTDSKRAKPPDEEVPF